MVWRAPNVLRWPRFWADEGTFHFSFAFEHGSLASLLFVHPQGGYFNLLANTSVFAASLLPLEIAPTVTTYVALLVQSIPLLMICYGESPLFPTIGKRTAGCLVVLFAPTLTGGIWLTSLLAHIFLGLTSLLILLENLAAAGRLKRWIYRLLLVVAGLSGPYTCFLVPLYALRAMTEKTRERFVQFGIVAAMLIVQLGVFWFFFLGGSSHQQALRMNIGMHTLSTISLDHIGTALLGRVIAPEVVAPLGAAGGYLYLAVFAIAACITLFAFKQRRFRVDTPGAICIFAFLVWAAGTSSFAFKGVPSGRYAVLPGYAVLFYVLHSAGELAGWKSGGLRLLLLFALIAGVQGYRQPKALACDGKFPSDWQLVVANWRKEPEAARFWKREPVDRVEICPPGKKMRLPHRGVEP